MPFHDYASIPDSAGKPVTQAAQLVRWQVAEGTYVQPETEIAIIQRGDIQYSLRICFPALIERQLAVAGSMIPPDKSILRWVADGENIPYGKAYFRTEPKA